MAELAFRCDGDDRVGAGHVARCIRIASAFRAAGREPVFFGTFRGTAATLLDTAGHEARPARELDGREPEAIVVDSYELTDEEVSALAKRAPTAFLSDGAPAPSGCVVVSYHLDAADRIDVSGAAAVLGPSYAPVDPALVAARRDRGLATALVTLGGGAQAPELMTAAAKALRDEGVAEVFIAAREAPVAAAGVDGVEVDFEPGGLGARIAWADVALSSGGSTPYDLACAGVPAALVAIAANQEPIAAAFATAGLATAAANASAAPVGDAVRAMAAARDTLAVAGPRAIDGYGAFRVRDALIACFRGLAPPRTIGYRPAASSDEARLLEWRNEPEVRAASRSMEPVTEAEHHAWLRAVLADPGRTLLVAEVGSDPVAVVRFDRDGGETEISVTVAPGARGRGLGTQVIRESSELHLAAFEHVSTVTAEARPENSGSLRAFEAAGFEPSGEGRSGTLALTLRAPRHG